MRILKLYIFFLLLLMICLLSSCRKSWLEAKNDLSVVVPSSLKELRLLLNNTTDLSTDNRGIGELSADNYFIPETVWPFLPPYEKSAATWQPEIFAGLKAVPEWNGSYRQVLTANIVLEALSKIPITETNAGEWDGVKGTALFYRARAYDNLAQLFAPPYSVATAGEQGIPLRHSTSLEEKTTRSTLQQTYDRITADLQEAAALLPEATGSKTDPSRPAAYALLARVYLSMNLYDKAFAAANVSLNGYNQLLDYNEMNPSALYPFPAMNAETLFYGTLSPGYSALVAGRVDSALYQSYSGHDLRKHLYFRPAAGGSYTYKGSYTGGFLPFGGLAVDEVYLIRAECAARAGNTEAALSDLNTLLQKRYRSGFFTPVTAASSEEALTRILEERRKELPFRGLRWSDLRRLNREPQRAVTLVRVAGGEVFTLPPNDPKYVLPIPDYVIRTSGIAQNPR